MPFFASHLQASEPSCSSARMPNPPPGTTMIAAFEVLDPASGLKTISLGLETFDLREIPSFPLIDASGISV